MSNRTWSQGVPGGKRPFCPPHPSSPPASPFSEVTPPKGALMSLNQAIKPYKHISSTHKINQELSSVIKQFSRIEALNPFLSFQNRGVCTSSSLSQYILRLVYQGIEKVTETNSITVHFLRKVPKIPDGGLKDLAQVGHAQFPKPGGELAEGMLSLHTAGK